MKIAVIAALALSAVSASVFARTYELKVVSSSGSAEKNYNIFQDRDKRLYAELKISSPSKSDNRLPIAINAASVFKNVSTKKLSVNDIQSVEFTPTNSRPVVFSIASGVAQFTDDKWQDVGGDWSSGHTIAGFIVEIFQDGKVIKHLTNIPGAFGKKSICSANAEVAYIEKDGRPCEGGIGFENKTKITLVK